MYVKYYVLEITRDYTRNLDDLQSAFKVDHKFSHGIETTTFSYEFLALRGIGV